MASSDDAREANLLRLDVLISIEKALKNWNEVSEMVTTSGTEEVANERLRRAFQMSEVGAKAVLDAQLRYLLHPERIDQQIADAKERLRPTTH